MRNRRPRRASFIPDGGRALPRGRGRDLGHCGLRRSSGRWRRRALARGGLRDDNAGGFDGTLGQIGMNGRRVHEADGRDFSVVELDVQRIVGRFHDTCVHFEIPIEPAVLTDYGAWQPKLIEHRGATRAHREPLPERT